MRPQIRTKDQALREHVATLRAVAFDLEELTLDSIAPARVPPPPLRPKLSWHESIRAKRISVPAAGAWAGAIAAGIEIARIVLEQLQHH